MPEPLVLCVMLTADRPAFQVRARRSFRQQTYQNKRLIILDTGTNDPLAPATGLRHELVAVPQGWPFYATVGCLRNKAIWQGIRWIQRMEGREPDMIAHFDDDDVSHPLRLEEQVALLEASRTDAVGYNEIVYWDTRIPFHPVSRGWLYTNPLQSYAVGASLLYKRQAWERCKFPLKNDGEDSDWVLRVRTLGYSGVPSDAPRLVAIVHGSNTSDIHRILDHAARGEAHQFKRLPAEMEAKARALLFHG